MQSFIQIIFLSTKVHPLGKITSRGRPEELPKKRPDDDDDDDQELFLWYG